MPQPRPDMHEGPPAPERMLLQEVLERNLVEMEREHLRAAMAATADTVRLVAAIDALRVEVEGLREDLAHHRPWWGRR